MYESLTYTGNLCVQTKMMKKTKRTYPLLLSRIAQKLLSL